LFYSPENDRGGRAAVTDRYFIAQCFYSYSTQLMINAAKVLGKSSDVIYYIQLLKKIKEAFLSQYVTANGLMLSNTQTAYVLALMFEMLPDSMRARAAERLVENIRDYNYHLTTGFLGTPYICHVLSRYGYNSIAYRLLLEETYPSWLYSVKWGATTIWERWNGIKSDSTFAPASMNSFNHYAYGAIGDWLYRVVAGIDTYEDAPGYKHSIIKPHPGGGLTYVNADLETVYGKLSSHWRQQADGFYLDAEIPANTSSEVYLPSSTITNITGSGQQLSDIKGLVFSKTPDGYVQLSLGSGSYHFKVSR